MSLLQFFDLLGVAVFAMSGVLAAVRKRLDLLIRDVLTAEVPMVIRRGHIYATAAIVGIVAYLALRGAFALTEPVAALAGMAVIAVLRISAIAWGWTLPVFSLDEPGEGPHERD